MGKTVWILAVLVGVTSARADPTILIRGQRLVVKAETPVFTFWVDKSQREFRTFEPGQEHALIEGVQLSAPPGLAVETLVLGVNSRQQSRTVGDRKLTWPAYQIAARLALTPAPDMATGAGALVYRFPGIARARQQAGTAGPEDVTLEAPVEVYASAAEVLQTRGPVMAWRAFLALGALGLAMLLTGSLLPLGFQNRLAFTLTGVTVTVTMFAAMVAVGLVAELMYWVIDAYPVLGLAVLVATNFWGGVCVFVGTGGLSSTRQPAHRLLALTCLIGAPIGLYMFEMSRSGRPLTPQLIGIALAGLVPGMLHGAARAAAGKPEHDHLERAAQREVDRERVVEAMRKLRVPLELSSGKKEHAELAERIRESLYRALEHAYAQRVEEADEEIQALSPLVDQLPVEDRPPLVAAAQNVRRIAAEAAKIT